MYMEWLETNSYQQIMGQNVLWLLYVDDILVVAPQNMDLDELEELNAVDPKIQLTIEKEEMSHTLPRYRDSENGTYRTIDRKSVV